MISEIYLRADFNQKHVHAGTTFRAPHLHLTSEKSVTQEDSGSNFSLPPWNSLNMALHVGDTAKTVRNNRAWVKQQLQFPTEPFWLDQVHGDDIIEVNSENTPSLSEQHFITKADGSYSYQKKQVLAIMTADCLPVLLVAEDCSWIAAAHCGWRSLAKGILKKLVETAPVKTSLIHAWMGPCISQENYQVGNDVRQSFIAHVDTLSELDHYFQRDINNRYRADLYGLARLQLAQCGVNQLTGGDRCTFAEEDYFYSYRREAVTGRMLSFIWLD